MEKGLIKIFIIEDDPIFGMTLEKMLQKEEEYDSVLFRSGESFFQNIHDQPDIVTIDYNLPGMHGIDILKKIKKYNSNIICIVLSGQDKADVVVGAYNHGADAYVIKNDNALLELKNRIRNLSRNVRLQQEVEALREQIIDRNKYTHILGESQAILKILKMIQKVERNNIMVLVTGDSGTGKELVAKAIHYNSPRKKKPFVPVNMAAIPEDLIESELFGHEKGAFTGASAKRIGKFEEAQGGTIFLDEIGEMDINLQTKLLRVLQDMKLNRIGSNKEIKLDVRVIAATNKNLGQRVKEGHFREDLYYRLQGFLIHMPPLKDRDNDIILLAKSFLKEFCESNRMPKKIIARTAIKKLMEHDWPGNVRELKSLIERAALVSDEDIIKADDLIFPQGI